MKKQDLIGVTDFKSNPYPTPSLHALEIYTKQKHNDNENISCLRETRTSKEAYVMLPGEVIPFEDYANIHADLLYLALFDVRKKLQELSQEKDVINYIIDVSGPSKASKEKLFYSTETPEDIRGKIYGFISLDDFLNLYMKKDFSYGLIVEIEDYETSVVRDSRFFFRSLPWPIINVSMVDDKMSLLLKLPDLEERPSPTKILELIIYYYKRVSLVLGMFDLESFRLILVNLNERDKNHELIGA